MSYISKLRKNLISIGSLQENGFSYKFGIFRDILKVRTGVFSLMREIRTVGNICKLLGNTIVCDVTSLSLIIMQPNFDICVWFISMNVG